jgi:hypothetical protein
MGDCLSRLPEFGQYALASRLEFQPGLRWVDTPRRSAQKAGAKVCFKPSDPSAHDGFGNSQTLGGPIEAAAFNDLHKTSQIFQFDHDKCSSFGNRLLPIIGIPV